MTGFWPKLLEFGTERLDSDILAKICQNHWNPVVLAKSWPVGRDPAILGGIFWPDPAGSSGRDILARSGLSGQIRLAGWNPAVLARWSECDQFGRLNLGLPDSGDNDLILSDFGTSKISVVVDCLNVKVDCVV
jgi:hypothetical protein